MQGVLMLSRVTVRDADFRRVTFDQFAPEGCTFERCDFSRQTLDRRYQPLFSSRRQSIFRDCSFEDADLSAELAQLLFSAQGGSVELARNPLTRSLRVTARLPLA